MNISRSIYLLLNVPRAERPLLTMEDMEVIVRRVKAGVSFGAEWGAEYDEVFSDGGVDDVHGTHSTTSVVEDPFFGIGVEGDELVITPREADACGGEEGGWEGRGGRGDLRVFGGEVLDDVGYHECCVWPMCFNS